MPNSVDSTKEAIEVFMNIKKAIDKLEDKKRRNVGSKLRTRAREAPEMMAELGLVPTLSYYLAKADVENLRKVIIMMTKQAPSTEELENIKDEELAYTLYTYAVLNYMSTVAGRVGGIELRMEKLAEMDEKRLIDTLLNYLKVLINSTEVALYELLQPYLLQFKRLCEAIYKPEER